MPVDRDEINKIWGAISRISEDVAVIKTKLEVICETYEDRMRGEEGRKNRANNVKTALIASTTLVIGILLTHGLNHP